MPGAEGGNGIKGKGGGDSVTDGDVAAERGDTQSGLRGVGVEIGFVPEAVVDALGKEKGVGCRAK